MEPSEIPAIRRLADRFPEMRYSVGVHPLDTQHWCADTPEVLKAAAMADDRVVAIGELGLDLFRDKNLEEQLRFFAPSWIWPWSWICRDHSLPRCRRADAGGTEPAC